MSSLIRPTARRRSGGLAVAALAGALALLGTGPAVAAAPAPSLGGTGVPALATATLPSSTNTGVPTGTVLKVHSGDLTITRDNAVISGLDVRGFVHVRASNVTIKNSVVRGRSTSVSSALVTVNGSGYSATIIDTSLVASTASPYVDGVHGRNVSINRVEIMRVIDQVRIMGSNVRVENSWLHSNAHFTRDPNWGGTPSHDDNIQIQAGSNIVIRNNTMTGSHNAGIMLTQDAGAVSNVQIVGNRAGGGACTINIKKASRGAPTGLTITDNTFVRDTVHPGCAVIAPTSYPITFARNYFTDGKLVVRSNGG